VQLNVNVCCLEGAVWDKTYALLLKNVKSSYNDDDKSQITVTIAMVGSCQTYMEEDSIGLPRQVLSWNPTGKKRNRSRSGINWIDTMYKDLEITKMTWEEAEEAAKDKKFGEAVLPDVLQARDGLTQYTMGNICYTVCVNI